MQIEDDKLRKKLNPKYMYLFRVIRKNIED
jgi:hypothetical protein